MSVRQSHLFPLLLLLPLLALACEGPKRTNKKEKPEPVKQEPPPEPVELFSATRSIDGRKRPNATDNTPQPVPSLRTYAFGQTPSPLQVPDSSIRVEPLADVTELPVTHKSATIRSVALPHRELEWEAALLQRGIEVLDRSSMPLIEREMFLQEARLPATGAAPRDIIKTPLVGRELVMLGREHSPVWMLQQENFYPLLNGRSVADDVKLPVGRHIAAQALLETSEFDIAVEPFEREAARPTASTIDYVPQVLTSVKQPEPIEQSWSMDPTDPFHVISKTGPTFFDPETRSLWSLTDAWIGYEVTRDEYIARRTSTLKGFCQACARELQDKATATKPSDKDTPLRWKCTECADIQPTRYVDGYTDGSPADVAVSLSLRTTWTAPRTGSYPVLAAKDAVRAVLRTASSWQKFEIDALQRETTSAQLGLIANHDWCHIDESLLATVTTYPESQKLVGYFGPEAQRPGTFLVPAIDANGAQIYVLATEPTSKETFQVPVVAITVQVRAVGVEDTRLLCAGTLRMNYRHLLPAAMDLPVNTKGLDSNKWPTVAQQGEALKKAACARIAAMLKP